MNRIILRIGAIIVLIAVLFPPCQHFMYDRTPYVARDFLLDSEGIIVAQYLAQILAVAFASLALAWAFARRKHPPE